MRLPSALRRLFRLPRPFQRFRQRTTEGLGLRTIELALRSLPTKPGRHGVILFHIAIAGQEAYILPIIHELQLRGWRGAIFLLVDDIAEPEVVRVLEVLRLSRRHMLRRPELACLGRIDLFITPTQWTSCPDHARRRICVFHGQPSKGNTFLPQLMCGFNALFLLGPLQHNLYTEFASAHPAIAAGIQPFEVGYPKSDALLSGAYHREEVVRELGWNTDLPIVLFAPAFDPGTSLELYGVTIIEELLQTPANVVVRLHPMHYHSPFPGGIDWSSRLAKFSKNKRFRHVGNRPTDPFLAASDVLITDVSGVALEFMMLDKPVVFIDCPAFFDQTLGNASYVRPGSEVLHDIRANAGRGAGLVVANPSALPAAVQRCLSHPAEFSPQRRAVTDQLLYNPGRAGSVAVDTLLRLL